MHIRNLTDNFWSIALFCSVVTGFIVIVTCLTKRRRRYFSLHRLVSENRSSSMNNPHQRENQLHTSTIEPFVRFDVYEKLLKDNEGLRQTDDFITKLLYNEPTSVIDKKLADYLKEH